MLRWALRRQGKDALPLQLAARRIYILPTRAGWTFALLILAMFIAGMNYGNGLALLLTFWLVGFSLIAMVRTQRSLAGARILRAVAEPAFAQDPLRLTLDIECTLAASDLEVSGADILTELQQTHTASAPGLASLQLYFATQRRGRWQVPVLRLQTHAPFGLFRTWTWLAMDVATLVYPRPKGNLPVPEMPGDHAGSRRQTDSLDELTGLRPFREGDSPRQVAWKTYARGGPLLVREYAGQASAARDFDYAAVPLADSEARLSQLARWIVDAAQQNQSWILRLPGSAVLSGAGTLHRSSSLQQLALFDGASSR
ncbi:MAG TPA: DUF58 domain-containing protein [Steroidobacteraceae bacterium]|nr:DUF58 domain-containing protein [Steroidobacteraceae bacterium]